MKPVERVAYWILATVVCVALVFHVERLLAASSQGMKCQNIVSMAEQMERDFQHSEFRAEHFKNPAQQTLGKLVEQCIRDKVPVRDCVMSRCMGGAV